ELFAKSLGYAKPQAQGDYAIARHFLQHEASAAEWISYGASPRGSIALDRCARAHAWLAGRDFVSPEDIQAVLFDVLRHRLILTFEAEAAGIDQDRVVQRILDVVAVA
ncbi:MAG: AAA family ATPase, partial [Pseudomonas aeruginosa]|nr:AAA family ATPase [Pseudomonas aeruginosa]